MTARLYGIPNCDTVKKARAYLGEQGVAHEFIDFKKTGVPAAPLDRWLAAVGWELLLNRKGNTWRGLDDAVRARVSDAASARQLMVEHPSAIKRPVVEWSNGQVTVGFNAAQWAGRR
jgi:arsenate reductase